jgi:tetratricopeptide (TPR) repeat protein
MAIGLALGQRTKVDINSETPEGKLLQQIGQEADEAKKLALLEDFQKQFPKDANLLWVQGQLAPMYLKGNRFDAVLPLVEALMAVDSSDAEMAHAALKAAEAKKAPDLIIKWAKVTLDAAKKAAVTPKPSDEDEEARWKYKVDFGKQVGKYAEYSVFAASLQTPDPATRIKLMDAVLEMNPKSEYASKFDAMYFLLYRQMGDAGKAQQVAENSVQKGTANEDMLLLLANGAFEKKDALKVIELSQKLVDYLKSAPNPEGVEAAAWEKKKATSLGAGYWMLGMTHAQASKFPETDAALREALPFLQGNDQLLAPALFQLGLANYRMGRGGPKTKPDLKKISDAIRFNQQCAAIKSPMQGQAAKNVTVIRSEYPGVK